MKHIRDIKIDLLTGQQNPIVDLFNELTSGIFLFSCSVFYGQGKEFIYAKGKEWLFYQGKRMFLLNHKSYCKHFETNFGMNQEEILAVTKYLLDEALKRGGGTTEEISQISKLQVGEGVKRKIPTPETAYGQSYSMVEEALEQELTRRRVEKLLSKLNK